MLELVVIACLSSAPTACDEHGVQLIDAAGISACKLSAGPHLEIWVRDHPDLIVRRWTCKPVPKLAAGT